MESMVEPIASATTTAAKGDWRKGLLAGAVGLLFCYGGTVAYLESGSDQLTPGLAFGTLFLVLAAQYFLGASREAKSWLGRGLVLIFLVDIGLEGFEAVRGLSLSRPEARVLLATGAVMLLMTALWAAYRLGVRSAKGG